MRTRVAHMRTPGSFDFASIERARRILETDMLQFLIASVPLQFAENNSYEGCSLSGRFVIVKTDCSHAISTGYSTGKGMLSESWRNPLECSCSWAPGPVRRTLCLTPLIFCFFIFLSLYVHISIISLFMSYTCNLGYQSLFLSYTYNRYIWLFLLLFPFYLIYILSVLFHYYSF